MLSVGYYQTKTTDMNKGDQRTQWTPELRTKLLDTLASGKAYNLTAALRLLHLGKSTLYDHMDPTLHQEIEDAKQQALDLLENDMALAGKDLKSGFLPRLAYLKAMRRQVWGDAPPPTSPQLVINMVALTPDQMAQAIAASQPVPLSLPEPQDDTPLTYMRKHPKDV